MPTDLTYTQQDLHDYLMELHSNLRNASFERDGKRISAPFKFIVAEAADNAGQHGKEMLLRAKPGAFPGDRASAPGLGTDPALSEILTLYAYQLDGNGCETVMLNDVSHAAKTWSLLLFSMARLMLLGVYPILGMHIIYVQLYCKASGLLACDANAGDRMCVGAALRRLNFAVRRELAGCPGTFGTAAYLYFGACTTSAYLDRDPTVTPLDRVKRCFRNLVFLRYWHAALQVTGRSTAQHFISMQTFKAFVLLDHAMVLLVLLWGKHFSHLPFPTWLIGSDQNERFFSELRSFVMNKPDFNLLDLLSLIRRWTYQNSLLARPDIKLPTVFSDKGYNRTIFVPGKTQPIFSEWPDEPKVKRNAPGRTRRRLLHETRSPRSPTRTRRSCSRSSPPLCTRAWPTL